MKIFTILLLGLLPTLATADPCHDPNRTLWGKQVNLAPLFSWWDKAETFSTQSKSWQKTNSLPPRPMPAWVRVTVKGVVSTLGACWVVEAEIEERPGSKFVEKVSLWHSPDNHYKRWLALKQQAENGSANASQLRSSASAVSSRADDYSASGRRLAEVGDAAGSLRLQNAAQERFRQASQIRDRSYQLQNNAAIAAMSAETARAEIAKMGQSMGGYVLDAFALRTGQLQGGLPVYELGYYLQPQ